MSDLKKKDLVYKCAKCGKPIGLSFKDRLTSGRPRCTDKGCSGYGSVASILTCGKCGNELPLQIMEYDAYLRFVIVGVTSSGKTTYLTTMMHELRHAPVTPWVATPMDNNTNTDYIAKDDQLYKMKMILPPTSAGVEIMPQQWEIKDQSRMSKTRVPTYSLTIFDGAGEDCTKVNDTISRYMMGSRTILIMVDPTKLPGIGTGVDNGASGKMVNDIADYIRLNLGLKPGDRIKKDIGVIFTKIDAIRDQFSSGVVMQDSPHMRAQGYVKSDADAVDSEIRSWLAHNGQNSFLSAVHTNFRDNMVRYFGVSALGHPAKGDKVGLITPHRVLDPLVWMLYKEEVADELID